MRSRSWRPVLTPGRRAHLEALSDGQPRKVGGRGSAGYSCRVMGWCGFAVRDLSTGAIIPKPDGPWWIGETRLYEFVGGDAEIITPAGLRMLGLETPKTAPASQ